MLKSELRQTKPQPGYIFIVGSSRTGTSVLRNVLNRSENVAICDETHFFENPKRVTKLLQNILLGSRKVASWSDTHLLRKLAAPGLQQELAKVGDLSTDAGVKKVVDYIYDTCWRWSPKNVPQEEFLRRLLDSDRSDRVLFSLIMTFYANGKPIRGEKTPAHIHSVPTLLEWFPNAKIVHTFRDPRTIFVLRKKKPYQGQSDTWRYRFLERSALIFEFYLSLGVIITWLRVAQLHHLYQRRYPKNYYLLRDEDLADDARTHLKKLCDFLKIDFTEKMLQRALQDPNFGPCAQLQGPDPLTSAIGCWRTHLHPITNKWFVLLSKKHLLEFGYPL